MKLIRILLFLILIGFICKINGEIYIHPNAMNITQEGNFTFKFTALGFDTLSNEILTNGHIKWDFGDLTETDYNAPVSITHTYDFPFPYPVAWCGYLNNTFYPKSLTYNWIIVGNVSGTTYIFNGSSSNSKTNWDVSYNSSSNTVIIKYYSATPINVNFYGLRVDTTPITVNVSKDEIVEGDTVRFNFSTNKNIIFCMWSFGDGTFSFERAPEHTYTTYGFYSPRVLVVDDSGDVMVGYLSEGIEVKRPRGGYIYWVTGPSHYDGEAYTYVYNSSGGDNSNSGNAYVDPYKITYRVNDTIEFDMSGAWGLYWKWDFGDGTETDYTYKSSFTPSYHKYKFPFMWPFFWMSYGRGSWWKSDTLNFIVVDDVGNTVYNFYPSPTHDKTTYNYEYNKENHTVNLYYYSDVISTPKLNIKLRDGYYVDITATADKTEVNVNENVKFDCSPYGNPIFIMWCFGDGSCSFEKSPTHRYSSKGLYYPHVFIINDRGDVEVGIPPPIGVGGYSSYPQIYASPTIAPTNYPINITIMEPASYTYKIHYIYFGDGSMEKIKPKVSPYSFTHEYNFEGVYEIYMKVDTAENMKKVYIIDNQNPNAELYVYPNPASYKAMIAFNPLNSYDPDSGRIIPEYDYDGSLIGYYTIPPNSPMARIYGFNLTVYDSKGNEVWNYTSNELKVVYHQFDVGNYTANLTVWDGLGGVGSVVVNFSVIDRPPVANFTYYPTTPKINENVEFVSLSYDPDGDISKYVWNFGDGSELITTNPTVSHKYTKPGNYLVKLTVFDAYNLSSSISKYITLTGIIADFNYTENNNTVYFTDLSVVNPGKIVSWYWDFGDGTNSTEQNPIHTYKEEGAYLVTLTVKSDNNLTDSVSKIVVIYPNPKYPPIADFTYKVNGTVVEFNASLSHDPDGKIVNYTWDFGDGTKNTTSSPIIIHKYKEEGAYPVILTVVDNNGLSDSRSKIVNVGNVRWHSVPIPNYINILVIVSTVFCIFYILRGLK